MVRVLWIGLILSLALSPLACGIKKELYDRDVNRLKTQIRTIESEKDDLLTQVAKLKGRLKLVGAEKGNLSADLQAALLKIEELKALANRRRQVLQGLIDSFQSMVKAGKLKVKVVRGMLIVELAENILFDTGKYKLKTEGEEALRQLANILKGIPKRRWQVAGHTDSVGKATMNWKLSTDRALTVVLFLIDNGMPPERLSAAGFGPYQPVATNETDEGKRLNRRIEVVLVPNLEEIMPKLQ